MHAPRQSQDLSALLRSAASGDVQAFGRIYDATAPQVLALLQTQFPEEDPELMLEGAYLLLRDELTRYDEGTNAKRWILDAMGLAYAPAKSSDLRNLAGRSDAAAGIQTAG